jgi:predicted Zn-dependent peptidase
MIEQFLATAFVAHPYSQPIIGWFSDLQSFSATDARAFFDRYYVPSNMVVAVVGDVKPDHVFALSEKYFGALPARPRPEPLRTVEPPQNAERQVVLRETAQPLYIEGYHRPSALHADDPVFEAISDILSNGRTSRLYRSLVRDRKIAAYSAGFSGFPGHKYPNLFVVYAVTTPGHTPEEARDVIRVEIERLKNEDVTDDELAMAKTRAKADLIRSLGDNSGLAENLATMQALYGDWRELFRQVERIGAVRKEDIRRVANATFASSNRTIGIIESSRLAGAASE